MLPNSPDAVNVGDRVVLGRYNFASHKESDVGKVGVVKFISSGTNMNDKYIAEVEIDGTVYWAVESLIPESQLKLLDPSTVKVGDKVIIWRPDINSKLGKAWEPEQDKYVGKEATIDFINKVGYGKYFFGIIEDGLKFWWDGDALGAVDNIINAAEVEDWSRPRVCLKCNDTNYYASYKQNHVCYACKTLTEHHVS